MRFARMAALTAALTLAGGGIAFAHGNPHFQNVSVGYDSSAQAVTASGSVAGLATHDVTVTLTGSLSADCENKGKSPQPPKGLHRSFTASGTFFADKNGKADFSLVAPLAVKCPGKKQPVNVSGTGMLTATVDGEGHEPLQYPFSF